MTLLSGFSDVITCLSFQFLNGVGPVRARKVICTLASGNYSVQDYVETVNRIVPAGSRISPDTAHKILEKAGLILQALESTEMQVLAITADAYPKRLAQISDAPSVLWVKGNAAAISEVKQIAVVGTRNPTEKGRVWCKRITRTLLECDAVIVSGLAAGCDALAHQTCLDEGGVTVAVMPSGLDVITPSNHRPLADRILQNNGTLVSEYIPGTKPHRSFFVRRNRVQSGLSDAVVVIQAGAKSGTMTTAKHCISQNRKLYCTSPDVLGDGDTEGGNKVLINQGAEPLRDRQSIFAVINDTSTVQHQGTLL